jgi:hypothetical protein
MDDLADFYIGELLHNARETIYHNQHSQPRRIVIACWDVEDFHRQFDERKLDPEWHADGRHVVVYQHMRDYRLMIYEVYNGTAELVDEVVDDQASGVNFWATTLVYDTSGETDRWKIVHAENRLEP